MALEWRSEPLLSMALLRMHPRDCAEDHAIHEAIRQRHLPALQFLLSQGRPLSQLEEPCGRRRPLLEAVCCAVAEGDVGHEMAALLLRHGARADAGLRGGEEEVMEDDAGEETPLFRAALAALPALVALLLDHGADPNLASAEGSTPLHACCRRPPSRLALACLALLCRRGADPRRLDARGRRAQDVLLSACAIAAASGAPESPEAVQALRLLAAEARWRERRLPVLARHAAAQRAAQGAAPSAGLGPPLCALPEVVFRIVVGFI